MTNALRTRSASRFISVSTGDTEKTPLFYAHHGLRLARWVVMPQAAFAADAANYWKIQMVVYDDAGALVTVVDGSSFSLATHSLVAHQRVILPVAGFLDYRLKPGHTLWVELTETGTAAALRVVAQVDMITGDR